VERSLDAGRISRVEEILVRVVDRDGARRDLGGIDEARKRRNADLAALDPGVRRLVNPHRYHVSLTRPLWELKQQLIERFG
jgi:nicotinate phosphoribosyltransferase